MTATEEEQVRAFLAKRGATKIPEGEARMTKDEWYRAQRAGERYRAMSEEDRLIEQRHTVVDSAGRVRVCNGLGEWIS